MIAHDPKITIARILRVNHAGEFGAIRIYGAQIFVCRALWKGLVAPLSELRGHEIDHCRLFAEAMYSRGTRPCHTMWFWSMGGWLLGFVTAILGPRSVWTCTEIVEANVHRHLQEQLHYLVSRDLVLHDKIAAIQEEEAGHLEMARVNKGADGWLTGPLSFIIDHAVSLVIWLSTRGDSTRMRRDLRGASA